MKFLLNQTVTGQFIAASATVNEDHHEDTKPNAYKSHLFNFLLLIFLEMIFFSVSSQI